MFLFFVYSIYNKHRGQKSMWPNAIIKKGGLHNPFAGFIWTSFIRKCANPFWNLFGCPSLSFSAETTFFVMCMKKVAHLLFFTFLRICVVTEKITAANLIMVHPLVGVLSRFTRWNCCPQCWHLDALMLQISHLWMKPSFRRAPHNLCQRSLGGTLMVKMTDFWRIESSIWRPKPERSGRRAKMGISTIFRAYGCLWVLEDGGYLWENRKVRRPGKSFHSFNSGNSLIVSSGNIQWTWVRYLFSAHILVDPPMD